MLTPLAVLQLLSESSNICLLQVLSIEYSKDGTNLACYLSDGRLKIRATLIAAAYEKAKTKELVNRNLIKLNGAFKVETAIFCEQGYSQKETIVVVNDYEPVEAIIDSTIGSPIKLIDYHTSLKIKEEYDVFRSDRLSQLPIELPQRSVSKEENIPTMNVTHENDNKELFIRTENLAGKSRKEDLKERGKLNQLIEIKLNGNELKGESPCEESCIQSSAREINLPTQDQISCVFKTRQNCLGNNQLGSNSAGQLESLEESKTYSFNEANCVLQTDRAPKEKHGTIRENHCESERAARRKSLKKHKLVDPILEIESPSNSLSPKGQETNKLLEIPSESICSKNKDAKEEPHLTQNSLSDIIKGSPVFPQASFESNKQFESSSLSKSSQPQRSNDFLNLRDDNFTRFIETNTITSKQNLKYSKLTNDSMKENLSLLSNTTTPSNNESLNTTEMGSPNDLGKSWLSERSSGTSSQLAISDTIIHSQISSNYHKEKPSAIKTQQKKIVINLDGMTDVLFIKKLKKNDLNTLVDLIAIVADPGKAEKRNRRDGNGTVYLRNILLMDVDRETIKLVLFGDDALEVSIQKGTLAIFCNLKLASYDNERNLQYARSYEPSIEILGDDVMIHKESIDANLRKLSYELQTTANPSQHIFKKKVDYIPLSAVLYEGTFYVKGSVANFGAPMKQFYRACLECASVVLNNSMCKNRHYSPKANYKYKFSVSIYDGSCLKDVTIFEPIALEFMKGVDVNKFREWVEKGKWNKIDELHEKIRENSYRFKIKAKKSGSYPLNLVVEEFEIDTEVSQLPLNSRERRISNNFLC